MNRVNEYRCYCDGTGYTGSNCDEGECDHIFNVSGMTLLCLLNCPGSLKIIQFQFLLFIRIHIQPKSILKVCS